MWVIVCETPCPIEGDALYWSNEWGWGSLDGCEQFTDDEKETNRLPVGGKWVQTWSRTMTQTELERLKSEQPDYKHAFVMKDGGAKRMNQTRKDLEAKYRKAARGLYHDPGHIEVDKQAEVSISENEDAKGCYVQAWVWVCAEEIE